jgi:hypothetical protein
MLKVALFLFAAATVVGCASTREERVAAIQAELPQLVDACNGAFEDGSKLGLGMVVINQGIDACDRLAYGRSLSLVRPATAELYQRYRVTRNYHAANRAAQVAGQWPDAPAWRDPVDAANAAIHDARAAFPAACTSSAPFGC